MNKFQQNKKLKQNFFATKNVAKNHSNKQRKMFHEKQECFLLTTHEKQLTFVKHLQKTALYVIVTYNAKRHGFYGLLIST